MQKAFLYPFGQRQQPQNIRDMGSTGADLLRQLRLGEAETIHQRLIGLRLLNNIQVLALDVFNNSDLCHLRRIKAAHNGRHFLQPRLFRRPVAALSCYDFVAVCRRTD